MTTTSKTERTSGIPLPCGSPESAKYYKTTITDDNGEEYTGCDSDPEKSQQKAQDKYERSRK